MYYLYIKESLFSQGLLHSVLYLPFLCYLMKCIPSLLHCFCFATPFFSCFFIFPLLTHCLPLPSHPSSFSYLRSWTVVLLYSLPSSPVSQCLLPAKKQLPENQSLSLVMLHLLDMSVGRITSKSGHRDLCLLCSWHRFRAVSRKPAGCFTLQINPTTGGNLCERQESWHVNAFLSVSLSCHLSQLNDFSFNVIAFWRWEFPLSLRLSISKVTLIAVI